MKNKAKRLLTAMLVGTLSFASVFATGCKKNKVPDTEQTLEVFAAKLGYGASWCEAELNAFKEEAWVKEKYPNLNVIFEANADRSAISTRLSAGAGRNTVDLIFSDSVTPFMGKDRAGTEYSCNLTDTVYNTKVPGEDITVYDKLLDTYKEALVYYNVGESALEEKEFVSYDFNWASGMRGILYNQELLESFGYKTAPRTSDELIEMSAKISADKGSYNKGYAFMWSGEADYIEDMYNVWWAQYEGYQQIYNYYNGIFYDGRNYVEKSSKIFEQEGREKALNALIDVMSNSKGYMYPYGSSVKFKAAQKSFIEGNGVFMSNGDWFAEEMKDDIAKSNYTIRMMRSPVISAIKDKTPSVTTDEQLRTIVSRIDAGCATISEAVSATPEAGDADISSVSAKDYETILAARLVIYSTGPYCSTCIPVYAEGKEVAFDFLRFLATDKAQEIYMRETGGAALPFKYDVKQKNPELFDKFSDVQKDRYEMEFNSVKSCTVLPKTAAFPLAKYGNLSDWTSFAFNGTTLGMYARQGGETAEAAFRRDLDYWQNNDGRAWKDVLRLAGLS